MGGTRTSSAPLVAASVLGNTDPQLREWIARRRGSGWMIFKYALIATGLLSFVGALASTAAAIYYGARCMAAHNDPDTPKHRRLAMLLFPAFVLLPWAQPPEKRKYAHRFAISIACLAASVGLYEALKLYIDSPS